MAQVNSYASLSNLQANSLLFVSSHTANSVTNCAQVNVTVLFASNVAPKLLNYRVDTPANSTAANCVKGETWSDGSYVYVATANNVCKRAALSSF